MHIHFIGIGGIGVSALAQYYLSKGHKISGSDLVSSEITKALKKKGVKIIIGKHKPENLPRKLDLVIYSPAVPKNNPELKAVSKIQNLKSKIQILSYPQALGELTKQHFTIAISGTHGKSTTTALIGLLLTKAGLDPTVIVGTKLKEFGDSNCRAGNPVKSPYGGHGIKSYLVIEADEHFASFLNYWPKIIVLTRVEADHLDYYKNLNNILKSFKEYISHLTKNGVLVKNNDDKNIRKIIYTGETCLYSLKQPEAKKLKKVLKIPGEHNVSNALAALTVARVLKIPDKISFKALSEYKGAWRRFEIKKGVIGGKQITVVSDYAHHPTEIRVTLKAAREKYLFPPSLLLGRARKKIWCVYQPHQYQRTHYLFADFVKAFKRAPMDKIIITDIYDVAGREEGDIKKKVNSEKLVKAVKKNSVIYLPKEKILDYLKKNLSNFDILIIMGAGDIYNLVGDIEQSCYKVGG